MRILIRIIVFLAFAIRFLYAAGPEVHHSCADIAFTNIPESYYELREIFNQHRWNFLTGSSFPDAAFTIIEWNKRWVWHDPAMIDEYLEYFLSNYQKPYNFEARELLAFILGNVSHQVFDQAWHSNPQGDSFLQKAILNDFPSAPEYAEALIEGGLDFVVIFDLNRWMEIPPYFYVPAELVAEATYETSGIEISPEQVVLGAGLMYIAFYGERVVAPMMMPLAKFLIPWSCDHYIDYTPGGINDGAIISSAEWTNIWDSLQEGKELKKGKFLCRLDSEQKLSMPYQINVSRETDIMLELAREALIKGIVELEYEMTDNGNAIIHPPKITDYAEFIKIFYQIAELFRSNYQ